MIFSRTRKDEFAAHGVALAFDPPRIVPTKPRQGAVPYSKSTETRWIAGRLISVELSGKIAVVTGSGGEGSGRTEAVRLASEGCCVLVSDINDSGGNETVRQITLSGGKAAFRHCNVSRPEEVGALVAFAEETFGGLDILINNASGPGYKPGAPPEDWLATIEIDLLGAIYGLRYALPAMRKRGGGAIVNVSSTSALTPNCPGPQIHILSNQDPLSGIVCEFTNACPHRRH